ncbi:hypothetical protein L596_016043 [Steinernema carpocapsae]|uniref:Uncharacterized protein n=1 Tax=Steinernema carpocapsae TaxID=34508 RepID=A0A4U5NI16_STECR|nr:hypothetical protein L596_016043 [Steinernema carpocapsae]
MSCFAGKVAIVTGSSNGIGQTTTVLLAFQGAAVTIHGRLLEGLQVWTIGSGRSHEIQKRIQEFQATQKILLNKKTVERFGKLNILVNNARVGRKTGVEYTSLKNYEFIRDVNIKSIIKLNDLAEPHLEKIKGNIVNKWC